MGIVLDQGPNYILAKRMQHWRACVARADGHRASSNVSPSTATASVTSNASFAAAFGGIHIFKPLEVIYQELSLSTMGALLIHDVRNPKSAANPEMPLEHPLCLFQATSFHGGISRCPYTFGTIGVPSVVTYYFTAYWAHIAMGLAAVAAIAQYTAFGTIPSVVSKLIAFVPPVVTEPFFETLKAAAWALSLPL